MVPLLLATTPVVSSHNLEQRIANMKRLAGSAVGEEAKEFYVTTFKKAQEENILTAAIWFVLGTRISVRLLGANSFTSDHSIFKKPIACWSPMQDFSYWLRNP